MSHVSLPLDSMLSAAKTPSALGVGTFTQIVKQPTPAGALNKSKLGDYVFSSTGGAAYTYSLTNPGSMVNQTAGLQQTVTTGNMIQSVLAGNRARGVGTTGAIPSGSVVGSEFITVAGIQKVTAAHGR